VASCWRPSAHASRPQIGRSFPLPRVHPRPQPARPSRAVQTQLQRQSESTIRRSLLFWESSLWFSLVGARINLTIKPGDNKACKWESKLAERASNQFGFKSFACKSEQRRAMCQVCAREKNNSNGQSILVSFDRKRKKRKRHTSFASHLAESSFFVHLLLCLLAHHSTTSGKFSCLCSSFVPTDSV